MASREKLTPLLRPDFRINPSPALLPALRNSVTQTRRASGLLLAIALILVGQLCGCTNLAPDPRQAGPPELSVVTQRYPQFRVAVPDLALRLGGHQELNPLWEKVVDYNAGRFIATRIEQAIQELRKFKVVDRSNLTHLLAEKKLEQLGYTEATAAGDSLLPVDAILVGEVHEFCAYRQVVNVLGVCSFTVKLVDSRTGEIIFLFEASEEVPLGSPADALEAAMKRFADRLSSLEL